MTLYKPKHILLIITLSLSCGYGLLWLLYHEFEFLIPNSEILIHILIYVIMYITTTRIYSTVNILKVHQAFGFKQISFNYIFLAVLLSFCIWGLDYLYQIKVLDIDMLRVAQDWNTDTKNTTTSAVFISMVIIAPIIEEILFRGIFLQTVNLYLNKYWSAFIISICFASIHFSLPQFPSLFIASWVYVWLTYKSGSIVPAVIAHIINNCVTFFYYIALLN